MTPNDRAVHPHLGGSTVPLLRALRLVDDAARRAPMGPSTPVPDGPTREQAVAAAVAGELPAVRSHRSGADVGIFSMGLALLLCAGAQLLLDGSLPGVAAGSASVVLVVLGSLLWSGVRRTSPRAADPVIVVLAGAGVALDELAAASSLAPQMVVLDADPGGLSLVAALLLGSAALVLGVRVAVVASADRTTAALVAALGAALVLLVALAVHADDPLPWSRGVDGALATAGAALALVHGRRRISAPRHSRRQGP